jgi:hypothetical protein
MVTPPLTVAPTPQPAATPSPAAAPVPQPAPQGAMSASSGYQQQQGPTTGPPVQTTVQQRQQQAMTYGNHPLPQSKTFPLSRLSSLTILASLFRAETVPPPSRVRITDASRALAGITQTTGTTNLNSTSGGGTKIRASRQTHPPRIQTRAVTDLPGTTSASTTTEREVRSEETQRTRTLGATPHGPQQLLNRNRTTGPLKNRRLS